MSIQAARNQQLKVTFGVELCSPLMTFVLCCKC